MYRDFQKNILLLIIIFNDKRCPKRRRRTQHESNCGGQCGCPCGGCGALSEPLYKVQVQQTRGPLHAADDKVTQEAPEDDKPAPPTVRDHDLFSLCIEHNKIHQLGRTRFLFSMCRKNTDLLKQYKPRSLLSMHKTKGHAYSSQYNIHGVSKIYFGGVLFFNIHTSIDHHWLQKFKSMLCKTKRL